MHDVHVEVVETEIRQRLLERRPDVLLAVRVAPDLRGYSQVLACDIALADRVAERLTDLGLVAVRGGAVDVAIADTDSFADRLPESATHASI